MTNADWIIEAVVEQLDVKSGLFARIYELVEMDVVNPAIALPALAEACATLVAGIEGRVAGGRRGDRRAWPLS